MILSAQSIDRRIAVGSEKWSLAIEPYVPEAKQVFGMSYGLTAAGYDIRAGDLGIGDLPKENGIVLMPGAFHLIASLERVKIPHDLQVIVHDKSSWARQGLALQNTVLEPGWKGYITLELSNHSSKPLRVLRGQPIAQLVFHQLDKMTDRPYSGKYQNQGSVPVSAIDTDDTEDSNE